MHIAVDKDNFKQEVLDASSKVIVDFWAPWCGPCMMLSPIMDEIGDELKDIVKVTELNVDENQDIALQYNVSSLPTILIFEKGQVINSIIGFHQKQDYLNALK